MLLIKIKLNRSCVYAQALLMRPLGIGSRGRSFGYRFLMGRGKETLARQGLFFLVLAIRYDLSENPFIDALSQVKKVTEGLDRCVKIQGNRAVRKIRFSFSSIFLFGAGQKG
jgi:hypothetical protein